METFEVYCKIIQYFEEIEKLCLSKCFVIAKKKTGEIGLLAKICMKCKDLKQEAQVLWRDNSLMRQQCRFFLGETDGEKIDRMLYQLGFILNKEYDNKEYLNMMFKEAYYPKVRYSYENDYPEGEPRAKFLLWESGANPYRDLQNIKKNKDIETSFSLSEICALFCEIRRVLSEELSSENVIKEMKDVFENYHISLD